jgi:hypothetical protein
VKGQRLKPLPRVLAKIRIDKGEKVRRKVVLRIGPLLLRIDLDGFVHGVVRAHDAREKSREGVFRLLRQLFHECLVHGIRES